MNKNLVTCFLLLSAVSCVNYSYTPRKNPAPNFVTHLECSLTGAHYPANALHNLSTSQKPLLARYDLEKSSP